MSHTHSLEPHYVKITCHTSDLMLSRKAKCSYSALYIVITQLMIRCIYTIAHVKLVCVYKDETAIYLMSFSNYIKLVMLAML